MTAPRSLAVAVFCSVMATGATPALSQPMDRQPFLPQHMHDLPSTDPPHPTHTTYRPTRSSHTALKSFSTLRKFLHPPPSLPLPLQNPTLLISCDPPPSPSPSMADRLVAGKPTERKGRTGGQIGDGTEPSLEGLAQKACQPRLERPAVSLPSSLCAPCCART